MKYDYTIVGAGLFGLTCGRILTDQGYRCLVVEKRNHIGGNCYTEKIEGINVHEYGPHIFHTNKESVWNFINKYTTVNHFSCRPKLRHKNTIYSFPINLMTLQQVWGVLTPEEAKKRVEKVTRPWKEKYPSPASAYEYALTTVGEELYEIFYKDYLTKQWNRDPKDIPVGILQRQVFRLSFEDSYYKDLYQGIPDYSKLFENLSKGIEVWTGVDFLDHREVFERISRSVIYTGPIDMFFNYKFGPLEYRSLRFEHEIHEIEDYQGTFMMSYPEQKYPFTRIIEHKHFEFGEQENTVITKEYPQDWSPGVEPFYPINDSKNNSKYLKYLEESSSLEQYRFGGRMGTYSYINMDQTIENALKLLERI